MVTTHNLGFPRIGKARELKFALESFRSGKLTADELTDLGKNLRKRHWQQQADLDWMPVGDFSYCDRVLDLERAGIDTIQIDEAAPREGLPLRQSQWQSYLDWAIESLRKGPLRGPFCPIPGLGINCKIDLLTSITTQRYCAISIAHQKLCSTQVIDHG